MNALRNSTILSVSPAPGYGGFGGGAPLCCRFLRAQSQASSIIPFSTLGPPLPSPERSVAGASPLPVPSLRKKKKRKTHHEQKQGDQTVFNRKCVFFYHAQGWACISSFILCLSSLRVPECPWSPFAAWYMPGSNTVLRHGFEYRKHIALRTLRYEISILGTKHCRVWRIEEVIGSHVVTIVLRVRDSLEVLWWQVRPNVRHCVRME